MKHRKLYIIFILFFMFLIPSLPVRAGTVYTLDDVNMRSRGDLSADVVCTVSANTKLTSEGTYGGWIQVSYQGMKGYIHGIYLSRVMGKSPVARKINASDVNFRKKPDGKVLRTMSKNENVIVISRSGKWMKIKDEYGKYGYVACKYLANKNKEDLKREQIGTWKVAAVNYCKNRLDDKYSQDKRDKKGYADCSSLMRDAFKKVAGGYIGDYTGSQAEIMNGYFYPIESIFGVDYGDIVYHFEEGENHCGIYIGDGVVINASQTVGRVKKTYYDSNSRYWEYACAAATYCYDQKMK